MTSTSPSAPGPLRRHDPRMQTVEMAALRFEDVDDAETLDSGLVRPSLDRWRTALLVAAGGALGTLLRFLVGLLVPTVTTPTLVEVPWGTFWVNLAGCLVLGVLTGWLEARYARRWLQPFLGVGLCGGFTSFSAVVLEGAAMVGADFPVLALGYAGATIVLGLGALVLGMAAARRLARRLEAAAA